MNERLLNHLQDCIPKRANNYMLSTYSIILEAWRRGLEISIKIVLEGTGNIEPYYTITDGKKTHQFSATRGDLVTVESKDLVKNKETTKEYLIRNNVPTPEGKDFDESDSDETVIEYAEQLQYPVVIKPSNGTGGRGVIAGIQNENELKEALQYVRKELNYPHIIVEKYYKGEDYRLYVIDGNVIAVLKRVRAHVIGDGKSTIKQLIAQKNKERTKLPSLSNRPIKVDKETTSLLKRNNYDLDSIVDVGEVVYLKTKNNVSAGGDSIDFTDQVSDKIKTIAINAAKSFPSLPHCGVDMIVDEENDLGVVIELNSRAHITQHLFPMEGIARDIPSHIIDLYFPDTKNYDREEANKLYIDYDFIYDSCIARTAKEIVLPKIPDSPITLKRYLLSNCEYTEAFAQRVKRLAFNKQINGYIKPLNNGKIAIVVGANEKKVKSFKNLISKAALKVNQHAELVEKNRTTPVQHGFQIVNDNTVSEPSSTNNDSSYIMKYSELKRDYQNVIRKLAEYEQKERMMELTNRQNKQLKKRLKQMESSTSWKVTKPLRKIMKLKK